MLNVITTVANSYNQKLNPKKFIKIASIMDEAHIKASKDLKKKEYPNRREIAIITLVIVCYFLYSYYNFFFSIFFLYINNFKKLKNAKKSQAECMKTIKMPL